MLIPFAYYDFFNTEENIRELYFFLTELISSHILRNAYSKKKYTFKFFIIMEHQLYIWDKNFSMKTLFTWIIHYLMLLQ